LQQDAQSILDGILENDRFYVIIFTVDDPESWMSERSLRMANPNYDISVSGDYLKSQVAEALQSARKQTTVKTKHLNIWCSARDAWMNVEKWNLCGDAPSESAFDGEVCWEALDLSSKIDIAARVRTYRQEIDGVMHYYAYGNFYLPEARATDTANRNVQHYQAWQTRKLLTITDGNVIDYGQIFEDLKGDARRVELAELVSDPWGATKLLQDLQAEGFTVAEFPQQTRMFSEPMKELEALVLARRFHHDGNPVLRWMVSNIVVKPDANENIFPRKERPESKIDGGVALIMSVARAMNAPAPERSIYESQGIDFL
jgi:phage terminase large subunit-like protein